jgi:SAM-dependent methyltransferase
MIKFQDRLILQRRNVVNSPTLFTYFSLIYQLIENEILGEESILEIGSGAGISNLFLKENVHRTDIFAFPEYGVEGNINMNNLPFASGSFGCAVAVDAIHHSPSPMTAIQELFRVVRNDGKIVIFEPFVSVFSYLPFKLFHSEATSWNFRETIDDALDIELAEYGDQGVSRWLISKLRENPEISSYKVNYLSWLSFFMTGGINRPLNIPNSLVRKVYFFEKKVPQNLMRFLGSRVLITLKRSDNS